MKRNDTHAFVNQLLVCLLVTICCGGSIGLGTVWMRLQISVTANANRSLATHLAEVERQIAETTALIASEQDLDVLRRRNAEWHLGLAPVTEAQVARVPDDPVLRLAALRNRDLFRPDAAAPTISFRVALSN